MTQSKYIALQMHCRLPKERQSCSTGIGITNTFMQSMAPFQKITRIVWNVQDTNHQTWYKPTNLKGQNNYLSHPASITTTGLCAQRHAPHFLLQVSTKLELDVYREQYMSSTAQPETLNLPAVRSCARMSMILERCSGVSLQKRGRPRIACTLTCKFLWATKLQGWNKEKYTIYIQ